MSQTIIRVENLGKKYVIPRAGSRRSDTLRDAITNGARALRQRLSRPMRASSPNSSEEFWALKDVNFEVKRGEVLGIIGRNGAGKSTLLKILSRVTEPTTGRVELSGGVASLLEVGTGFHPELTGRENIYLNGSVLGMSRSEINRRFDAIVDFADISAFLDTAVKHYSSGMYVRLAFAVAAHLEPKILVIDEVLAVGDAEFQKKCLGRMGEASKQGRTVLVVSHNMASIVNLCTRAILLQRGQMVHDGLPIDVVQHYLAMGAASGGRVTFADSEEAPGTALVRLLSVRILQEGLRGPTPDVDISKDVLVEITYRNIKEDACLYVAFWLKDQLGTVVFSSGNQKSVSSTADSWSQRPHPTGVFRSICRIPGNFLNEGKYLVTPILGQGVCDTQVLEEDLLSFQVHDTGEMRKEYYGGWIGVVRPKLAWDTERVVLQVDSDVIVTRSGDAQPTDGRAR